MAQTLDDLVARIADGQSVDWSQVRRLADDPVARELIAQLQAIERLHDSHRSVDDGSVVEPHTAAEAPGATAVSETASTADAPARRWGKYVLLATLGEGSFGTVYRAHDDDLRRDLAIKLLHPRRTGTDNGKERLRRRILREAQDLARIRHPNVVTIYAVEEHDGQVGLCMELIEGRTLDALVRADGPMNAGEAAVVGRAVGKGLAAIHQAGLLHRDVKPKNVMRERAGRYVLMDLGASLDTADASRVAAAGVAGTPLFMAPEALTGPGASVRSDIYGLGVLLYFLVTGRCPVEGPSRAAIERAHAEGKRTFLVERRQDLPESFVRVVERALSREPGMRHASAAELLTELDAFADSGIHAQSLVAVSASRSVGVYVAAAAAALLAVTGALMLSGALSSAAVNHALSRPPEFAPQSVWTWLNWGRKAALPFGVYFGVVLLICHAVRGVGVLVAVGLRRLGLRIPEPTVLARRAWPWTFTVLGVLGLFVICVGFSDLVDAAVTPLDSVSVDEFHEVLSFDAPTRTYKASFGRALAALAGVLVYAWSRTLLASRRRRERPPVGAVAIGAASLAFILFVWSSAYQVLWFTDSFVKATYQGRACFILGTTPEQVLLSCPTGPAGERTLALAKSAPSLEILPTRGSPYDKP